MDVVLTKVESFADDRASRYFDPFPSLNGQISISVIPPHSFSGWHMHLLQTDQFFVADGVARLGVVSCDNGTPQEFDLSPESPSTVTIPPRHWHAWRTDASGAVLVYYLSRKHDENDEMRATVEQIAEDHNFVFESRETPGVD